MRKLTLLSLIVLVLAGCGGPSEPEINGKWNLTSVLGDGREMVAEGDWLDFHDDGSAVVKMGGQEEEGTWKLEKEKTTLVMRSGNGEETRYDYQFRSDSLYLKTMVGKGHTLQLIGVRTETSVGHGH